MQTFSNSPADYAGLFFDETGTFAAVIPKNKGLEACAHTHTSYGTLKRYRV